MDRRVLIVIILTVAVVIVLGFTLTYRAKHRSETAAPADEVKKYLVDAGKKANEGDLLKARELYSKIIEEHPDSLLVEKAQEGLEKLNMSILFSPAKTENSVIYIVKDGDTLGKIAKRHNTTVELIMRSNGLTRDIIRPGQKLKLTTARFSIFADKSQHILTLKADDDILKVYPISTGLDNSTPVGKFTIVNKLADPTWYKTGAVVPPGSPDNILGSRWMGLSLDGYGIHGTTDPDTIGSSITAGCIRMYNKDVEELYSIVPIGTEVTIVD